MIEAFEAGAVFRVVDHLTPFFERTAARLDKLSAQLKLVNAQFEKLGNVRMSPAFQGEAARFETALGKVGAAGAAMGEHTTGALDTIGERFHAVTMQAERFAAVMATIAHEQRLANAGIVNIPGLAQAPHGAGNTAHMRTPHLGPVGLGGIGLGPVGTAAAVAGVAGYEGIKAGGEMQDAINKALVALNVPVGPDFMNTDAARRIQQAIEITSQRWGTGGLEGLEHASVIAMRSLAPLPAEERLKLLPHVLDFAGTEMTAKGASAEEAAEAGVALAHQLRAYGPEKMEPLFKTFAQVSMASPDDLTKLTKAFSYSLPLLTAGLDIDPMKLMAIGTAGSQMGLTTKGGTWIAQLFSRSAPDVQGLTEHERAGRVAALRELHLLDDHGNLLAKDANGRIDPIRELQIISDAMKVMSPEHLTAKLHDAFGEQGGRGAGLFANSDALKNIIELSEQFRNAPEPEELRKKYEQSPKFQLDQQISRISTEFERLGNDIMPAATAALKKFNDALDQLDKFITFTKSPGFHVMPKVVPLSQMENDPNIVTKPTPIKTEEVMSWFRGHLGLTDKISGPLPAAQADGTGWADSLTKLRHQAGFSAPGSTSANADKSGARQSRRTNLTSADLAEVASILGSIMADKLNGAAVNMDGRQVGSIVMKQINRAANKPPDGSSGFDLKLQPAYPTGGLY